MTGPLSPAAKRTPMAGCLLGVILAAGCPWGPIHRGKELSLAQADRIEDSDGQSSSTGQSDPDQGAENDASPDSIRPHDDPPMIAEKTAAGVRSEQDRNAQDRARFKRLLAQDTWIRVAQVWDEYSNNPVFRWRYPALDDVLVGSFEAGPILAEFVEHEDPVVAANAAIGLARLGNPSAANQLARAIRDQQLELPIRRAAVESLASLEDPSTVTLLRELLDDYFNQNSTPRSFCSPSVHAELVRGLSWHIRPADDIRFSDALASDDADVKLEALRSWIGDPSSPLPEDAKTAGSLRADRDWRVRSAALTAMAQRPDNRTCEYLAAAVTDPLLKVRVAAIAGLGELQSSQSKAILENLLEHPADRIRAEAVSALALMDAQETVLNAAGDKSWQVRKAVARALAKWSDHNSAAVARDFLEDPSCKVQQETVTAVAEWPLRAAGPILLGAMTSRVYATRRSAANQLQAKWPPATEFPHDGPIEQRAEVLLDLESRFRREIGFVQKSSPAVAEPAAESGQAKVVLSDRLARVRELLEEIELSDQSSPESGRRAAILELAEIGPDLVDLLERLARDRKMRIPETVYRDVLAEISGVFEVLFRLTSPDVATRRRAVNDLAKLSTEHPLGWLSMYRLSSLCITETDPLVWSGVFQTVAADRSETSARIACTGIGHSSPEVRRLACRHLGAHPRAEHVRFLTPALEDSSAVVVRAAIGALGTLGHSDAVKPLERLLATANESLRVDAAMVLAQLNAPSGPLELERLCYSADESIRLRVVVAMGQIGDRTFTGQLIRLLDDRHTIRRAALDSLPKVVGRDVAELAGDSQLSFDRRLELWKDWSRRQSGALAKRPGERQPK